MSEPSAAALVARFHQQLRPAEASALQAARAWSENADAALYLVGGSTRDLLLDVAALDIDIAVEGDAVALGALLASGSGATLTAHPDFGTAIVQ